MFQFLTTLLVLILVTSNCHGCSFIKEHFAKKEVTQSQEQQEEGQKQETPRKVEPIPINPQHS